jgi:DNA primase
VQSTFTEKISFIERAFGKGVLSRSGDDIAIACPECKDSKKKKLSISLNTWGFHCWVCNTKGRTLVPLLRKYKSRDLLEEYRRNFLNQKFSYDVDATQEQKFEYPAGFIPVVNLLDSKDPNVKASIKYLRSRGLTDSDLYRYRAGVTPNGKDSRRVYFISLDSTGEENYFVSRSIDPGTKQRYVNSTIDKMKVVFNECEVDWDSPVYLVEGIFDQIRLGKNSICMLGSSLPESSLLFKRIVENQCHIILALDSDAKEKERKIADMLIEYGCNVDILTVSNGKDLGSMSGEEIEKSIRFISPWNAKTSLLSKIGMIRSGSVL